MPLISPERAAARARAAIAYAGLEHAELAQATGLHVSMIRRIVAKKAPRDATIERLWAIADACQVPRAFMERGWDYTATEVEGDRVGRIERRLDAMEQLVNERLGRELREGIQEALRDFERAQDRDPRRTGRSTTARG